VRSGEERNNRRDHVIACAQFLLRRRRTLLRGHTLLASSGTPVLFESLSQMFMSLCISPSPPRTLTKPLLAARCLASCLAHTISTIQATSTPRQTRRTPPTLRERMDGASAVYAADRASYWRRTSSFRAEPCKPWKPVEMGIVVSLGRTRIACARIACAQTAGGANVRLASVMHRCAMGALHVRTTSSLGAHGSRRCTACSSITRRSSAFSLQLDAKHRARTAMAQQQLDRQRRTHTFGLYSRKWLFSHPTECLLIAMIGTSTQYLSNLRL
jgi:hypothetical protein